MHQKRSLSILILLAAFVSAAARPARASVGPPQGTQANEAFAASYAANGVRKLLVICPAFVSDCLETLEEIGIRGRETFRRCGGINLTLIPCLNDHSSWIKAVQKIVRKYQRAGGEEFLIQTEKAA